MYRFCIIHVLTAFTWVVPFWRGKAPKVSVFFVYWLVGAGNWIQPGTVEITWPATMERAGILGFDIDALYWQWITNINDRQFWVSHQIRREWAEVQHTVAVSHPTLSWEKINLSLRLLSEHLCITTTRPALILSHCSIPNPEPKYGGYLGSCHIIESTISVIHISVGLVHSSKQYIASMRGGRWHSSNEWPNNYMSVLSSSCVT